ncbi:MAG: DUF3298 and DUF4163 domain-containing protein [Candidatus Hydrogenedentes bacterium]|nr:DUF3298 and DUF4163 domain-containing protein [Candidatus Hydrogenedentota bacterium]
MVRVRVLAVLLAAMLAVFTAAADQFAYVTQAQAHKAAAVLSEVAEVQHFCAPCGDEAPRSESVDNVEVKPAGYEDYYEVLVNGQGVDLAYVYIKTDEGWVNLALEQGLEASDVPRVIEVDAEKDEGGEDAPGTLAEYAGTLGETNHLLITLATQGKDLSGTYFYERIGQAIELEGTVDAEGQVTLTESVDGKKTGVFNGVLSEEGKRFKGAWMNPEGSKTLPFELRRYATQETKTVKSAVGSMEAVATVSIPVIASSDGKSDAAFNKAINMEVNSYVEGFQHGFLEAYSKEEDAEYFRGYETELGYDIAHYSPRLLSLIFSYYEYTGGAHGNTWYMPLTVLMSDAGGTKLSLADLFLPESGYAEKLSAYCIADLKKQEAGWVVDGATESYSPDELSSFTVSRAGITIHFAPYIAGP